MKLKGIYYIFVPILSLFVMTGCGSSSSSDNQPNSRLSEESRTDAMYISMEEIDAQKKLSVATTSKVLGKKNIEKLIKEDAERDNINNSWTNYDRNPSGATMQIVYDDLKSSRVVEFNGDGLKNGYVLGYSFSTRLGWGDTQNKMITWSMSFSENYILYVRINTTQGYRYLYYTPTDYNYGIYQGYDVPHYIHHGLGSNSVEGSWRTFTRDLEADLKEFNPDNTFISVDGFFVRGSGRIDDIELLTEDTTPVTPPSVKEAVKIWLVSQGFNEFKNLNFTLSTDKTRTVVSFSHFIAASEVDTSHTDTVIYILDTSNVNDIKELNRNTYDSRGHRTSYTGASIVDGKYIVENSFYASPGGTRSTKYYHNYNTGEYVNSINISQDFSLIQCENEDYSIFYGSGTSGPPVYRISIVDMSNIEDIKNKSLYSEAMTDSNAKFANVSACAVSSDKSRLFVKDASGNVIEEFNVDGTPINRVTEAMVKDAINKFVKENIHYDDDRVYFPGMTVRSISPDKTRAVGTIETDWRMGALYILDISDLNNIKILHTDTDSVDYHYNKLKDIRFVQNNYIVLALSKGIDIYDYRTGEVKHRSRLLTDTVYGYSVDYIDVTDTYATYSYTTGLGEKVTRKIDYSDINNPVITLLSN